MSYKYLDPVKSTFNNLIPKKKIIPNVMQLGPNATEEVGCIFLNDGVLFLKLKLCITGVGSVAYTRSINLNDFKRNINGAE